MKLKTFSFFHLNLAYSAIGEAQRKDVIERCYWPLLRLARARQLPFGIEVSAWTLETIAAIDPEWLAELRDLVTNGPCEFIGCGYSQVIGPLVPAEVNEANFRIGMQRYEALLGMRPKIALINEQAYSAGLVPLYGEAGYEALIMEWNNPARSHPEWDAEWRYLPQYACGTDGTEIPLIWNKSVAFQKVQRFVHGEMDLDEYLTYVLGHIGSTARAFPIYGNDVEVFDFRPGRYMTEAPLHASGEWHRIKAMYEALQKQPNLEMVAPSEVLKLLDSPGAGNRLHLGTAAQPVPVKKQDKYNLLRWAVTGRADLEINTECWRIYEALRKGSAVSDVDWTELCYLWSSDFRTHITESRWVDFRDRLQRISQKFSVEGSAKKYADCDRHTYSADYFPNISQTERFIDIEGDRFSIRLNCMRGLALESFVDKTLGSQSLCGTIPHGYYDDIKWSADFYTGHLVFESPGKHKVTDLIKVQPKVEHYRGVTTIFAVVETSLGPIKKTWVVDEKAGFLSLKYDICWPVLGMGCLRLGHITLNPECFSEKSLVYKTHNGGFGLEEFKLMESDFDHGDPVSFLVSASQGIGVTQGIVVIGDDDAELELRIKKSLASAIGLITHKPINDRYFSRVGFTLNEMDDTSSPRAGLDLSFEIEISPKKCRRSG